MAATGDGLESKDLQTMISDRNETAEMMVKRVWPRVDSWKVQWSKKLTSMRFKVRWHDDSPKGTITLSEAQWAKCRKHCVHCAHLNASTKEEYAKLVSLNAGHLMMQRITGNMDESLADLGVESMKIKERDPPSVEALRRTTRTDFLKDLPARMDEVLLKLRGVTTISKEIKKEMREMVQKMFSIPPDWMHKSYFNVSMSKQLKRRYCQAEDLKLTMSLPLLAAFRESGKVERIFDRYEASNSCLCRM